MFIPVYVALRTYTMYSTLFPEVMKQETSLFLCFLPPLPLSLGNFCSVKKCKHLVFEISEFTYYPG